MNVYGCQLWKFNGKHINTFFTAWRKAIRRIWKIPFRSHNKLVHLIMVRIYFYYIGKEMYKAVLENVE